MALAEIGQSQKTGNSVKLPKRRSGVVHLLELGKKTPSVSILITLPNSPFQTPHPEVLRGAGGAWYLVPNSEVFP